MNNKRIKKLRKGKVAVENNGTLEQLKDVLGAAFPKDTNYLAGNRAYYKKSFNGSYWVSLRKSDLPTKPISWFYENKTIVEIHKPIPIDELCLRLQNEIRNLPISINGKADYPKAALKTTVEIAFESFLQSLKNYNETQ